MLVLTRKVSESVVVERPDRAYQLLKVIVLGIHNGSVRLGFEADVNLPILRTEIIQRELRSQRVVL